jgi:hypothetical protein
MPAESVTVDPPPHPLGQLTTAELADRRRELEHAADTVRADDPAHITLCEALEAVQDEEEDRRRIARRSRP